ncbi:MAG: hypothetical protein HUU21_29915, partial [Polyangiaceae bacterium]|nr:hypothetical protein [Polyangiaceae bacterium]
MALRRLLASHLMGLALACTAFALAPLGCGDGENATTSGTRPGTGGAGGEGATGGQ